MIVSVDITKLDIKTLEALIEGTTDEELLDELYKIDYKKITYVFSQQDIHRKLIQNNYASEDLLRKIYERYFHNSEIMHLIVMNPNTPEELFIEILQNYTKRFNYFGYLEKDFLYNENLTDKAISVVYNLYKKKDLKLQRSTYRHILADERTGSDVLLDALKDSPDDETICAIATHPKMKIVPASE